MKITLSKSEAENIIKNHFYEKGINETLVAVEIDNVAMAPKLSPADWANMADKGQRKIFAIKMYRTLNPGVGLAEAKTYIEDCVAKSENRGSFGNL